MLMKLLILIYLLIGNAYMIWHDKKFKTIPRIMEAAHEDYLPKYTTVFVVVLVWCLMVIVWPLKAAKRLDDYVESKRNRKDWNCSPGKHEKCNCKQPHDCWYRDRGI